MHNPPPREREIRHVPVTRSTGTFDPAALSGELDGLEATLEISGDKLFARSMWRWLETGNHFSNFIPDAH